MEFANREKITECLYPLFVHDIGALLYHPSNPGSNRAGLGQAGSNALATFDRRRADGRMLSGPQTTPQTPSMHHPGMGAPMVGGVPPSQTSPTRPGMERAHTFPTPPASAGGVVGMNSQSAAYDQWGTQSMASNPPLTIETNTNRSVPNTPATTPPGKTTQGNAHYPTPQSYDASRPVYSNPATQSQYQSSRAMTFGGPLQPAGYQKSKHFLFLCYLFVLNSADEPCA